jgi:serine 3-dehydrogenase
MADLQDSEWDDLKTVLDTNVTGLVALTRACLPRLIASQGIVVNLSSVAGTYPYRGGAVYGATKAFVRQFSLMLRNDLAGTGVRVTSIEPGMAETEFTLVRNGGDQAASDALYAGIDPMTAEDLANTILWVATQPAHLNFNSIELMPTRQNWAGFSTNRKS